MTMYAICSAFGVIFVAVVIKETRGKSLHTIDKENDEQRDCWMLSWVENMCFLLSYGISANYVYYQKHSDMQLSSGVDDDN